MKPTLTTLLIFLISLSAYSQTNRNSFIIGGNATAGYQKTDYSSSSIANLKTTSASLSPSVGFFVIKNLCVGLSLPVSISSSKYEVNGSGYNYNNSKS